MTSPFPLSGSEGRAAGAAFAPEWDLGRRVLRPTTRPLVMGVVNLTDDSFYAASRRPRADEAVAAALAMADAGAEILDLGAESTRPGAEPVSPAAEQDRLLPVLEALRRATDLPVSVDTYRPETAALALAAGADAVNDVTGGRDPAMLALAAERAAAAEAAGVATGRIAVDPGVGFGKRLEHNLALLAALPRLAAGRPLLLGASRKRFIAHLTGAGVDDRLGGSLAALAAAHAGRATVVRVHDVAASVQFLDVLAAIDAAAPPNTR